MKLLLDTHAYIWWVSEEKRLSAKAWKAINARASDVYISAISAYEMAFKYREGKLPRVCALLMRLEEDILGRGFMPLSVTLEHGRRAGELADEHGDPFDRILSAQAICEAMAIVTNDEKLSALGAKCLW